MHRVSYILSFLLLLLISESGQVYSQTDSLAHAMLRNWRVDIHSGAMFYYGDLVETKVIPYPRDWRAAYGLILTKEITPEWGVRSHVLFGNFGARRNLENRHYRFSSSFVAASLQTTYDFSSFFRKGEENPSYRLYGLFGAGMLNYETSLFDDKTGESLSPRTVDGNLNSSTLGTLSLGLGLDVALTEKWRFLMESSYMGVNSDQLDGWEGGSGKNDVLQYTSLGFGYRFNWKTYRPITSRTLAGENNSWKSRRSATNAESENRNAGKEEIKTEKVDEKPSARVDAILFIPEIINGNEEFLLSMEVSKADIKGKAEIRIVLPENYIADDQDVENVVFLSMGRNVTLHLRNLPESPRFPVRFKVRPVNPKSGDHSIYLIGKIADEQGQAFRFSTVARFRQIASL